MHDVDGLDRVASHRRFSREHHRVRAVVDGGRDVRCLRPGRHRRRDHRFQHLGGHDDRFARIAARAHDSARDARDVLRRKLHAEVAACDHDRVGQGDDLVELLHRGRLLELRHQLGPARDRLTHHEDVLRPLDEGRRHPVRAELQAQREVTAVLVGERRDREHRVGDVDALVIRYLASDPDPYAGEVRAARLDLEPDLAVVDQQVRPRSERREHLRVRQRDPVRAAGRRIKVEGERRALLEHRASARDLSDPELRSLQVEQHSDRPPGRRLDGADRLEAPAVAVVVAVAEVEPEHVDSGREQCPDHLRRGCRRAERGDDLRKSVSSHCCGSESVARPRRGFRVRVSHIMMRRNAVVSRARRRHMVRTDYRLKERH